jgi:hypothetical protein
VFALLRVLLAICSLEERQSVDVEAAALRVPTTQGQAINCVPKLGCAPSGGAARGFICREVCALNGASSSVGICATRHGSLATASRHIFG